MLISTAIPNLINGVSQQPASLRLSSQCELQENAYPSVVEGLKKRPPTYQIAKIISGTLGAAFLHTINRDVTERYKVVVTNGDLRVFDLAGDEKTVSFPNGKGYLTATTPKSSFRAVTIADYTFLVNREIVVALDAATSPAATSEGLVYIKQGNYSIVHKVIVDGMTVATYTTHDTNVSDIRTDKIAEQLTLQLNLNLQTAWAPTTAYVVGDIRYNDTPSRRYICTGAGTSAGSGGPTGTGTGIVDGTVTWDFVEAKTKTFTFAREGSTIQIKESGALTFSLKATDSNGDRNIVVVKETIQRFTDLPNIAPDGFRVHVTGDPAANEDDYYVAFETQNGENFGRGVWAETLAPGITYKFDPAKMPHTLVRNGDGTFTFDRGTWAERKAGDETTVPTPSFVGTKINDVFFYRNRLAVLADENVVTSRAGSFFNFWKASATTLLDSDPIDTAASSTKVSILKHAVPFDKLLLFSDQTQFIMDPGELLTPKSPNISPVTNFENSEACKPLLVGKNVYFAVPKGEFDGVREYFVDKNTDSEDAADVTAHIPAYIPSGLFRFTAATNEDILCGLTTGDPEAIYAYKFYWAGDEKLQSAWSKWRFGTGVSVLDAGFIDMDLYLVVQREDGVYLERLNVAPNVSDPGFSFEVLLDRKITEAACSSVTYNAGTGLTTWTLPYAESGEVEVVTRPGGALPVGVSLTIARPSATTVTASGDHTAQPVYIGKVYEMVYDFSAPTLKEKLPTGGEAPVSSGRIQVRTYTLVYSQTGYFRIEVTPDFGATYTYTFTGRILGSGNNVIGAPSLEDGKFSFPVRSKNDRVHIRLVNDSFVPCRIQSAEWEGFFVARSRRM